MGNMNKCCDWSVLHVNLMEEIWAWLPIESVCRFRSVSKEWNVLLSSREFITNSWVKKTPNKDPWLVTVVEGASHKWLNAWVPVQAPRSLASCFFDQTWKEISAVSLSFLQQYPEEIKNPIYSFCHGSAAGLFLLCRIRDIDVRMPFVVCNPLTRTHVELPVFSLDVILNAGIMSDSGDAYKVVVMGTAKQSLSLKVEIYDSIDKSWRIAGHLPENVKHVGKQLVFCNGYLYCLATISLRRTVVGYNIGEGSGTSIFRPLPEIADRGVYMVPHLLNCGSRVLVAAHMVRNSEKLLDVIIWELEKVNLNSSSSSSWWKEIARIPPSHLKRLSMNGRRYSMNGKRYFVHCKKCCVGVGDSIYFIVFQQRKVSEILAYGINENTWSWLPNRPWSWLPDHPLIETTESIIDTTESIGDCWEMPIAFEPRPDMKVD